MPEVDRNTNIMANITASTNITMCDVLNNVVVTLPNDNLMLKLKGITSKQS